MAETRHVHLHRDNDATEQREDGIAVRCPFCGATEEVHVLQGTGCGCGAIVRMEVAFEKDDSDN